MNNSICPKCNALFEDGIWVPFSGVEIDEQGNVVNRNSTLSQRVCRPHGNSSCINPDKETLGGMPWDTQLKNEDIKIPKTN